MLKMESVMLVDDSAFDNFIHQKVIENEKLTDKVLVYDNPKNALHYLFQVANKAQDQEGSFPSLIFLDNLMPGMDSEGFLLEFERLPENVKEECKIVLLTSAPEMANRDLLFQNKNVLGFIEKPLTAESLKTVEIL